jgi:hypothetical protein
VRKAFKLLTVLMAAYLVFCAAILAIMYQPPVRFAKTIAKVPGPVFLVPPFETLWRVARGGRLSLGDKAPDFDLSTLVTSAYVRLSAFQGRKLWC